MMEWGFKHFTDHREACPTMEWCFLKNYRPWRSMSNDGMGLKMLQTTEKNVQRWNGVLKKLQTPEKHVQ